MSFHINNHLHRPQLKRPLASENTGAKGGRGTDNLNLTPTLRGGSAGSTNPLTAAYENESFLNNMESLNNFRLSQRKSTKGSPELSGGRGHDNMRFMRPLHNGSQASSGSSTDPFSAVYESESLLNKMVLFNESRKPAATEGGGRGSDQLKMKALKPFAE